MNAKIRQVLKKKNKTKIICLTSYSKNISEILDKYTDIILVGDSLGSVLYSYDTKDLVPFDCNINSIDVNLCVVDIRDDNPDKWKIIN